MFQEESSCNKPTFFLVKEDDGDMIHTLEQKPSSNHIEARRKKYEDATEATNKTHTRVEIKRRL